MKNRTTYRRRRRILTGKLFSMELLYIIKKLVVLICNYDTLYLNNILIKRLGGVGKIVKIDESKFGKHKYHREHAVEREWIFGGIQRDNGACFLISVEKRDRETLSLL